MKIFMFVSKALQALKIFEFFWGQFVVFKRPQQVSNPQPNNKNNKKIEGRTAWVKTRVKFSFIISVEVKIVRLSSETWNEKYFPFSSRNNKSKRSFAPFFFFSLKRSSHNNINAEDSFAYKSPEFSSLFYLFSTQIITETKHQMWRQVSDWSNDSIEGIFA